MSEVAPPLQEALGGIQSTKVTLGPSRFRALPHTDFQQQVNYFKKLA